MDGMLSNFDKSFQMSKFDKDEFKRKVMDEKLFESLDWMPNAKRFLKCINTFDDINIEILSSLGAPKDKELQLEVCRQKKVWLDNVGLDNLYCNFVEHKGIKKRFATPKSILIDDTLQNVYDFNENYGIGLYYEDENFDENCKQFLNIMNKMQNQQDSSIYSV